MKIKISLISIAALFAVLNMLPVSAAQVSCSALPYTTAPNSSDTCLSLGSADPYNAIFRQGTSNIGVLFLHGRGQDPNGDVVRQLRNSLNSDGYTTLSIEDPVPPGGTAFNNYVANETIIQNQLFLRVELALAELKSRNVDRVVLAGFSLGSRFATASAAAWELNQLNTSGLNLIGLLGVGLYSSGPDSTISNINVLNSISNLSFITSIPVLDIYGDNDTPASTTAAARRAAYAGDNYTQVELTCPNTSGNYFVQTATGIVPYYGGTGTTGDTNRCHQLRNGLLFDPVSNSYVPDVVLRGSPNAPLETTARNWFASNFALPEPKTWLLVIIGLLGMGIVKRHQRGARADG